MKADVKSSGIAAPVAQPRHLGELGTSLASYSDDLKNGANNFVLLINRIHEINNDTMYRFGEELDGRDYRAIAFEIETSIYANLMGCTKATREGFLRAMADFLSITADGCCPGTDWSHACALSTTARAFATSGAAA